MQTKTLQLKIPKLRFSGFSGQWEEKKLGKIVEFLRGASASKSDARQNGKYPYIMYGELFVNYKEIIGNIKSKTDKNVEPKSMIGDILMPSSDVSPTGLATASAIFENGVVLGGDINILRPIGNDFDSHFLSYLINFKKKSILRLVTGTTIKHIYISEIKNILYKIPSLLEQQKIASFLGSIDKEIVNLRDQKEKLEEHKRGIMQKIFSQEIRFKDKDGRDFPKWKEKQLGEILKERKEYSIKGKGYPHISLTIKGVVPKSKRYDRDFLVGDDEVKGYKITRLNDLCYNPANLKFGVISINKLGAGIFSPIYVTFEIINQNIDFVGYYLIRDAFINKARKYEQGTVYERMAVHPSDFLKVKVSFPSVPEQQKIADFLTSIDKLIESKQQQINQAEQWKKGLMQGLFV